jgi:hypothetical protein
MNPEIAKPSIDLLVILMEHREIEEKLWGQTTKKHYFCSPIFMVNFFTGHNHDK